MTAYLTDFGVDRRSSVEQDSVLHQVLDAQALNLLQEDSTGLLPCSEVDLCYMISQGP